MFYIEIECDIYKPYSINVDLKLLRDTSLIVRFGSCKKIVIEARKKFKDKKRNAKRNAKINCLRIVNKNHETVFEVKMLK